MTSKRRFSAGLAAFVLLTAASLIPARAHADGAADAWATAKGLLTADPGLVVGINVAALKGTATLAKLMAATHTDDELGMFKTTCGLDPLDAIQGVVFAMEDVSRGPAFVVIAHKLDQQKITDCFVKLANSQKETLAASKPDAQGIVDFATKNEHVYMAFKKNLIIMAIEPGDKALLQRYLGNKGVGAASNAGMALGKLNTSATVWGVFSSTQKLDTNMTMKAIYGTVDLKGKNVAVDAHVVMAGADDAKNAVTMFNKEKGNADKGMVDLLKSLNVSPSGPEVLVKVNLTEDQVSGALMQLMSR